jgi:hypothetical protein
MGTIVARKRNNGSTGYTAQILRKKKGVTGVVREGMPGTVANPVARIPAGPRSPRPAVAVA